MELACQEGTKRRQAVLCASLSSCPGEQQPFLTACFSCHGVGGVFSCVQVHVCTQVYMCVYALHDQRSTLVFETKSLTGTQSSLNPPGLMDSKSPEPLFVAYPGLGKAATLLAFEVDAEVQTNALPQMNISEHSDTNSTGKEVRALEYDGPKATQRDNWQMLFFSLFK